MQRNNSFHTVLPALLLSLTVDIVTLVPDLLLGSKKRKKDNERDIKDRKKMLHLGQK